VGPLDPRSARYVQDNGEGEPVAPGSRIGAALVRERERGRGCGIRWCRKGKRWIVRPGRIAPARRASGPEPEAADPIGGSSGVPSSRAGHLLQLRAEARRPEGRRPAGQAGLGGAGQPSAPASARFHSRRHDPALRRHSGLPLTEEPACSLLPLSARLVVAEGRARRLFRPSQRCTITPAAGPSPRPRRPGAPALPKAGERPQARPRDTRLSRTKREQMPLRRSRPRTARVTAPPPGPAGAA
jgi:hypothetical protein